MKKKIMMFFLSLGMMLVLLPTKVAAEAAVPQNVRWDGKTARWDAVEGAKDYAFALTYGTPEMSAQSHVMATTGISFMSDDPTGLDVSEYINGISGDYYFKVAAVFEDGTTSDYVTSEALTLCKVSFVTGDAFSLDDLYVVSGETIDEPEVSGLPYDLVGWYCNYPEDGDPVNAKKYDFSAPVTEDIELTASFVTMVAFMTEDSYKQISPPDQKGLIKLAHLGEDPSSAEGTAGSLIFGFWAAGREKPGYTLLAEPKEGYVFVKWMKIEGSGDPECISYEPQIDLPAGKSTIVYACFRNESDYPVTGFGVSAGGTYSVYPSSGHFVHEKMNGPMNLSVDPESKYMTIKAEPESGFEFEGWYEGIEDPELGFIYECSDVLISSEPEFDYAPVEYKGFYAKFRKKTSDIKPKTLKIEPKQLELGTYYSEKLNVTVTPEGADDNLIWTSSDENVVSVDSYGTVRAKTYGKAVITGTSVVNPSLKATVTIQTRFFDVMNSTESYYKPVYWGADNGVVAGFEKGAYFGPDQSCTRAQFVTFLWRLAGKPAGSKNVTFTDITGSENYFRAIKWAVSQGIIVGFKHDDGTAEFRPDDEVTRGQVATMLWRYAGKKTPTLPKTSPFTDIDSSNSAYRAVVWGQAAGIIKGYKTGSYAGQFRTNDSCLRQHIVTFLYRYARDVMGKNVN